MFLADYLAVPQSKIEKYGYYLFRILFLSSPLYTVIHLTLIV